MATEPNQSNSAGKTRRPAPGEHLLDEALLRELIEQIPLTVYIDRMDEASSSVYTGPQLESILGYTPEEWAADPDLFKNVLHPDDRDRVLAEHARSVETGEPYSSEYRMIARDGRVVWFLDQATVIRDQDGKPAYYNGFLLDITRSKELEEALRRSEEELRQQNRYVESLLEINPTAIVTLDLEGRVTSWNIAAEALFGYTRAEAIGRVVDDLIAGEEELRREADQAYADVLNGGRYRAVTRRLRKDGGSVDVEVIAVPVISEDKPAGYLVIYHDISSVQEAYEARREAEKRYRELVEHLPLVTYIDEPHENAPSIYISPQVEGLLGFSASEWLEDPEFFPKRLHPEDRERVMSEHEAVFASGESGWSFEYRLISRNDRVVWIRDQATVVKDEEGNALYVQGFLMDVTEQKLAEQALREAIAERSALAEEAQRQKRYYEALLENSPAAVVVIDREAIVTAWNPAAERLFAYTREETIGRNIDDLIAYSPELHEEAVAYSEESRKGYLHATTKRLRKDGGVVDVEVLAVPVIVNGERVGWYAIYHDISELQRARHEADAANEAKSAFLATMSHEIRTPMNAIIGMTGLLLETDLTPEQRGYAEVIRKSGDALLEIINGILDFSKIEAGKLELELRPFDLRDCVESSFELVETSAAEKSLDLAYRIESGTPRAIVGDETRLRQVLTNLLNNAVKFTETGEVVLLVEAKPLREGRHQLHFSVRDTGIGIPEERMATLFESFSQVDASTTRRYGGTGLGLAISRRLAELMGGTMWAESTVGEGSTFHFTIEGEAAPALARPFEEGALPQLKGRRVLIVDDNATNRQILAAQTGSWGMLARETGAVPEALDWIRRGDPFDVAILDMQMPGTDGLMLAREIRRYRDASSLPLVMLTSLGRRDESPGVEFAAYLTKPIKPSHLYESLLGALGTEEALVQVRAAGRDGEERAEPAALRVLVAEDNVVNQQLALRLLEKMGYRPDLAANGVEVLEALERQPYDVVLMDVQMPELDGLEATRQIHHRWPAAERPRIVAVTANAMQGDREVCLAAGMDDYVAKPIRKEELVDVLSRCEPLSSRAETTAVGTGRSTSTASERGEGREGQPEEVLDPQALGRLRREFAQDDPGFVATVIDLFLDDAPKLLATLHAGLERGDADEVRRAAHTLKSNAANFGASGLAERCKQLEALGKNGKLDDAAELTTAVDAEYEKVRAALGRLREEL